MTLRQITGDFIRKRNFLEIEYMRIPIKHAPSKFSFLRIAHISDVHIPRCAFTPRVIAETVRNQTPDVIFLTGDVIDGRSQFDGPTVAMLIELLIQIAPIYAVSGNHERKQRNYYKIWRTMLVLRGVHFMDNKMKRMKKEGMTFIIAGIGDTSSDKLLAADLSYLSESSVTDDECLLILHHKPHLWRLYYPAHAPIPTVVFSGHAHGGQVRLPFIKRGLFAPNQGFLPKYTSGLYYYPDESKEVVSRGLASVTKPVRINNRPHIPIVELVSPSL